MKVKGKCAIVTGGANGIGREVVKLLVSRGLKVVFDDVDTVQGKDLERELNGDYEMNVWFVPGSVTQKAHMERLFYIATHSFGGAKIVVNNAAVFPIENMDGDLGFIDSVIAINFQAVVRTTYLAIQNFTQQQEKAENSDEFCIVNLSSITVLEPVEGLEVYGATKAGLANLTTSLAHLKQTRNIRINSVLPSFIKTPGSEKRLKKLDDPTMITAKFGRGMAPVVVAEAIYRLIKDSELNGVNQVVDEPILQLSAKL